MQVVKAGLCAFWVGVCFLRFFVCLSSTFFRCVSNFANSTCCIYFCLRAFDVSSMDKLKNVSSSGTVESVLPLKARPLDKLR